MILVLAVLVRNLNPATAKSNMSEDHNKKTETVDKAYYFENGFCVFTEKFLLQRGYCCGNGCRHCPYQPKHQAGNTNILSEFVQKL